MAKKGWRKFAAVLAIVNGAVAALMPLKVDVLSMLGDFAPAATIVTGVGAVAAGILLWNNRK